MNITLHKKLEIICVSKSILVSFIEHGPVDDETVVPRAAADDQAEHKQCESLFLKSQA